MARVAKYKCPVCKKSLTKNEYEKALHIHEAAERERQQLTVDRRKFELQKKQDRIKHKRQIAEERRRAKLKAETARKAGADAARKVERARTDRIVGNANKEAAKWKRRFELLKRGQTAQEYGPQFEQNMLRRLRKEFVTDDIQRTPGGRGGDLLHIVKEHGGTAGSIIYECKWTPSIKGRDVRQAALAKMSRRAEFAVLVTSGTKNGFGGMAEVDGVLIVSPACVVHIAGLLRLHLVEMLRSGIGKEQRAKIADQLLKFIKSPEFKNPLEEVVRTAEALKEGVEREYKWHVDDWKRRLTAYEHIRWDGFAVQENLRRGFHGEKPKQMIQPRVRLALPGSSA